MRPLILVALLWSCSQGKPDRSLPNHLGAPVQDTAGMYNAAAFELGRQFFYSSSFSADGKVSCASCHLQNLAFSDGLTVSPGAHGKPGQRNTPGLFNLLWKEHYHAEGGVQSLERQVLAPVLTDFEMNLPPEELEQRLLQNPQWAELSRKAYGKEPDAWVFTRSLGVFLKNLISAQSPYDAYLQGDTTALSADARAGRRLFFSPELKCSSCHTGPLLQGLGFVNNGVPDTIDYGRGLLTLDSADFYTFPIPSLRNVALTAPYMHNGSMATLDEVLQHYARGGAGLPYQDARITGFELSAEDARKIKAFFNSLTDSNFISDPRFRAPVQQ